ncbi:hypothetical protein ISCGN_007200 [Ixodes scapularis]
MGIGGTHGQLPRSGNTAGVGRPSSRRLSSSAQVGLGERAPDLSVVGGTAALGRLFGVAPWLGGELAAVVGPCGVAQHRFLRCHRGDRNLWLERPMHFFSDSLGDENGWRTAGGWQQPSQFLPDDLPDNFADVRTRSAFAAKQRGCSDAWMPLVVGSAGLKGALDVCRLGDEGVDGFRRVADEASEDVVSHPAHEDSQLLLFCSPGSARALRRRTSSTKPLTLSWGPWVLVRGRSSALSRRWWLTNVAFRSVLKISHDVKEDSWFSYQCLAVPSSEK